MTFFFVLPHTSKKPSVSKTQQGFEPYLTFLTFLFLKSNGKHTIVVLIYKDSLLFIGVWDYRCE
jgi:hypothetical protein